MVAGSVKGRVYNVYSSQVIEKRSIPDVCYICNEAMLEDVSKRDRIALGERRVYSCHNGHERAWVVTE